MHMYPILNLKAKDSANIGFVKAVGVVCCLVILLAGMTLLHVGKADADAPSSVVSPSLATSPATVVVQDFNQWNFQFTATSGLAAGDQIMVEYPEGFSINSSFLSPPIVDINGVEAGAVTFVAPRQLQITVGQQQTLAAQSTVSLLIKEELVANPSTVSTEGNILLWTSNDTKPVTIPITVESSSLEVTLSNYYEGAERVNYRFSFAARQNISAVNPLQISLPYELSDLGYADPLEVTLTSYLNGNQTNNTVSEIYGESTLNIIPEESISAGSLVVLEFTPDAWLMNPYIEGNSATYEIGVGVGDHREWAEVTILKDNEAPTGSIAVHGIAAGGTTFSRSILLDLAATDADSGVVGYEISETGEFSGYKVLAYKPQVSYILSSETDSKTIYVRFYDASGNYSEASSVMIEYNDKLILDSLSLKDEGSASIALSPLFSDTHQTYDAVVSSSVNTVKIPFVKPTAVDIEPEDLRAVYTAVDSTHGEITFSNLSYGNNDLKIKVSAGGDYIDYHVTIYREGPALKHMDNITVINDGSIISLGGENWILADKNKRQLILLDAFTGCEHEPESDEPSGCHWDGGKSSWYTEGDYYGYEFDPLHSGSIASHLNGNFLDNLGSQSNLISSYPFDNKNDNDDESKYIVKAAVGLLSVQQYQSLKLANTNVLNPFLDSEWFLMNSHHGGQYYYMFSVDGSGNLVTNGNRKKVHPVIYLKPGVVINGGTGVVGQSENSPYTLGAPVVASSNANITSVEYNSTPLSYSESSNPPVFSLNVENETTSAELMVTLTDPDASLVVDGIEQPTGGAEAYISMDPMTEDGGTITGFVLVDEPLANVKTVHVTGLPVGPTTIHVHGLAADGTPKNYDIRITRAAPVSSDNANLSLLQVGDQVLSLIPNQPSQSFTVSVANNVYSATVLAAVYQPNATMKIVSGTGVVSDLNGSHSFILNVGNNIYTIEVTAENNTNKQTYTITINRAAGEAEGPTQQQLQAALDSLQLTTILNGNTSSTQITNNLTLPALTGVNGFPVSWDSKRTAYISPAGTVGIVTRPTYLEGDQQVVVEATVTNATYPAKRTFNFTVLKAELLPKQEVVISPGQTVVSLDGGITVDFAGSSFGPGAKVSVTEVAPLNTSGTGLTSAGRTLEFKLEGITIDPLRPVKVSIPTNSTADRAKVGIFFYNPTTQQWEYQKTRMDSSGAAFTYVTHFSTYGVFEANKVASPTMDASLYTNDTTKQVALSTSTAGAQIFYTLDGSTPTSASVLYNASNKPKLTAGQSLKVIAVKNGMVTSEVVTITGTTRKTIANVMAGILNRNDQNGDSQFNYVDVQALLLQVESLNKN
jgi:hypothetical protein